MHYNCFYLVTKNQDTACKALLRTLPKYLLCGEQWVITDNTEVMLACVLLDAFDYCKGITSDKSSEFYATVFLSFVPLKWNSLCE